MKIDKKYKHSRNPKLLKERDELNLWDKFGDVLKIVDKMKKGEWKWFNNMKCKYINVRIDMRDGGCIIEDRDGRRILPEDLEYQHQYKPETNKN